MADNVSMATAIKRPARKQPKLLGKGASKRSAKTKLSRRPSIAKDAAERKKIGKTLDLAAFMAHHRQNTVSAAHWETEE
jgi:hypothetical protein